MRIERHERLRRRLRTIARLWRCESGATMIETALGLSVMFTMALGVMEFCMMGYTYSVYADAARAGLRYAITHGSDSTVCSGPGCTDSTAANVSSAVTSYASKFTSLANNVTVNVTYPDNSAAPPSRVQVSVSYTYKPMLGLSGFSKSFSATVGGRIGY